jgi:hypothetical protein
MAKKQLTDNATGVLPPLYAAWMDELLGSSIPPETESTCDDCAMCAKPGEPLNDAMQFFSPQVKCCSYLPELPNFLVGRILSETGGFRGDKDPSWQHGRASVEARLRAGVAVTPLGLGRTPTYGVLYAHSSGAFGRSRAMRCPHYLEENGGRCGIYRHRAAVCVTWFCKYVRGAVGMKFWRSLHQLLSAVETNLSRWCVLELDVSDDALRQMFPFPQSDSSGSIDAETLDGVANPATYRALWGQWLNREEEFYRECARRVNALDWKDVMAIGGPEVQIAARLTREAFRELTSDEIPPLLRVGSINVIQLNSESSRVVSYNSLDPIEMTKSVMEVLPYFDGRSTDAARRAIVQERGVRLSDGLIRQLTDFGILVPSENSK